MTQNRKVADPTLRTKLGRFAERNRIIVNAKLRQNVRLLEGPLIAMLVLPECRRYLDFSIKRKFLNLMLERRKRNNEINNEEEEDEYPDELDLKVDRESIFEDTFAAFKAFSRKEIICNSLNVQVRVTSITSITIVDKDRTC